SNAYASAASAQMPARLPSAVKKMPGQTLRDLPLPGGEVEVVPPSRDFPAPDLEDPGHRQRHLPAIHGEAVDPFGEDDVTGARDGKNLELRSLSRRREHVEQLPYPIV